MPRKLAAMRANIALHEDERVLGEADLQYVF